MILSKVTKKRGNLVPAPLFAIRGSSGDEGEKQGFTLSIETTFLEKPHGRSN